MFVIGEAVDSELFDRGFEQKKNNKEQGNVVATEEEQQEEEEEEEAHISQRTFSFLSIFKWEWRKGWDILLQAYWDAFKGDADASQVPVVLKLRTWKPGWEPGPSDLYVQMASLAQRLYGLGPEAKLENLPKVMWLGADDLDTGPRVEQDLLTRAQLRNLLGASDAFVLPSRGEGWGLPIAEAMTMSLPVLVSNCSGITEYANSDNAFLIRSDGQDAQGFCRPSVAELTKLMREVRQAVLLEESKPISDGSTRRENFQTCSADHAHTPSSDCQQQLSPIQKARAARDDMASKFSPAAVASKIFKRLGSLHSPLD
jgi:glycosyltransferase involved in cell wall biosynthesis